MSAPSFQGQLGMALIAVTDLHQLLASEFDLLRENQLDAYMALQPKKMDLLSQLKSLDQAKKALEKKISEDNNKSGSSFLEELDQPHQKKWTDFLSGLKKCDELHRKIDFYLNQKIKTTNTILEILQVNKSHNATSLYDALGNTKLSTIGQKLTEA